MTDILAMHDIVDSQLQSSDERRVGRVADILCQQQNDGSLELVSLTLGPEAGLRRIGSRLGGRAHRLFNGRFERSVGIGEVVEFGPTLRLREKANAYDLDDGDRWAARLLRFIPGSGVGKESPKGGRSQKGSGSAGVAGLGQLWVSDLIATPVRTTDGDELGHVVELGVGPRTHRVTFILVGSYGWLGRLGMRTLVHRLGWWPPSDEVRWERVERVRRDEITVRARRAQAQSTISDKH